MKMKILYISNMFPTPEQPYYGIFIQEQIQSIAKLYPDIKYDIYSVRGNKNKLEYLSSIFKINYMIDRNDYDIIHIHYGLAGLFLLGKRKKKIPVIMTLHGGDIQIQQKKYIQVFLTKRLLRKVDTAIVLNKDMENIVKSMGITFHTVPCAVDTCLFKPNDKLELSNEKIRILFPSDPKRPEKNYPLFQKVIAILRERYHLSVEEIELTRMTRTQVAKCLCNTHIVLLTSYSEGSPQVVKEALACNTPVVSTPVGDVRTLLQGVKNCIVVQTFDAEEIVAAVLKIVNNEICGITGREKIYQLELDKQHVSDKIYDIYKKIIR